MAVVNGSAGNDVIHVAGDGVVVPVGYTDFPQATGGGDTLNGLGGTDIIHGGGGDDLIDGGAGDDTLDGGAGQDTIDGGAGTDLVRYGGTAAVQVDLTDGSGHGGDAEGDVLSGIDDVQGTAGFGDTLTGAAAANRLFGDGGNDILNGLGGDDTLNGGDGSDVLRGGAGADTLIGGAGIDLVSYYGAAAQVIVDLGTGTGSGGDADGDTYAGIENASGGTADDIIRGNAVANVLNGYEGTDRLFGLGGADTLNGGDGDDTLLGDAGADRLDGGNGIDVLSYFEGTAAVTVDLGTGLGSGGEAQGDVISGIELVAGTNLYGDTLTGSAADNHFGGFGGNDILSGLGGADLLEGGDGDDVLRGGAGADALDGGAGTDTASYFSGTAGVVVSLASGLGGGGEAQGDTLSGIENLSGSQGSDSLYGNAGANVLQGWNGNDALFGRAGKDALSGGAGADRFTFTALSDSVVGANADRITDFSHAQGDRIDLAAIDASTAVAGDQAFSFIGTALFTGVAGQLRFAFTSPGVTTIAGDVNGDGTSDFHIQLTGAIALVSADFVL
ncbi:calcium-binding protein [Inquilinus sp. CA228]|uniref:calcium-binding protein n=1 Tax=Inquilinus sp. CA228 TaxID=3455609 RepID=UPI003F8D8E69